MGICWSCGESRVGLPLRLQPDDESVQVMHVPLEGMNRHPPYTRLTLVIATRDGNKTSRGRMTDPLREMHVCCPLPPSILSILSG